MAGGRRVLRWWSAGLVGAVLLAGLVTVAVQPGAPPVETLTRAPRLLTDRGASPTVAALRALDACLLADERGSGEGRRGPHTCEGVRGGHPVEVTVGRTYDRRSRWYGEPIVVGGVRAYRSTMTGRSVRCTVDVPVTFRYAIEFVASRDDDTGSCPPAEQAAAAAVPLLRTVPRPPDPGAVPLTDVDPCAVLAAAGPYDPAAVGLDTDSLDGEPGIDRCTAPGVHRRIGLRLAYGRVDEHDGWCKREVPVRRPGDGPRTKVIVDAGDDDCAAVEALVARVPAALAAVPPLAPPTRPVRLFAPDEPDGEVTGPCADLPFDECREPAVALPALRGVDAILAGSGADASFTCSMARDAVNRVFGPTLRPTVYGSFCHFVDGRHEIDVGIAAGPAFDLRDYDKGDRDRRDVVLSGHEAHYTETATGLNRVYDWIVRPRPGPPDPVADEPGRGILMVAVTHGPPRGRIPGPDEMPADPAMRDAGERLVVDLLASRFR